MDPIYGKISKRFHENPDEFNDAFAKGLVQADAPRHGSLLAAARPGGSGAAAWQDPVPAVDHP
jgi:catalase-peroxidase